MKKYRLLKFLTRKRALLYAVVLLVSLTVTVVATKIFSGSRSDLSAEIILTLLSVPAIAEGLIVLNRRLN